MKTHAKKIDGIFDVLERENLGKLKKT